MHSIILVLIFIAFMLFIMKAVTFFLDYLDNSVTSDINHISSFDPNNQGYQPIPRHTSEEKKKLFELRRRKEELERKQGTMKEVIKLQQEVNDLEKSMMKLDSTYEDVYINYKGGQPPSKP